jgi:Spy/CpxP family protein refolding chaperone
VNRAWFLLLAASIGLNAAMLYMHFAAPAPDARPGLRERGESPGDRRGPRGPGGEGRPEDHERMIERRLERMSRELDLAGAQVDALRAIARANVADMERLRDASRVQRSAIHELLSAAEIDSVEVRAAGRRLREIDREIGDLITDNLIREASVLEPDQRAAYLEMLRLDRRGRRGRAP